MDDEEKKAGFRVMDRRRFDSDGNSRAANERQEMTERPSVRSEAPPTQQAAARPEPSPVRQAATSAESGTVEPESADGQRDFMAFVIGIATQAAAALNGQDPRSGMTVPTDPAAARELIDILEMLQRKTKGNLSPDEATMFDQVLHQLRLAFVRATRGA